MKARLATAGIALLIALDVLLCTLWLAPLYVVGLASKPTGRQLISGYVGKARLNGQGWARVAGGVIDWIFARLGDGPDHCGRVYRADRTSGE